MRIAFVTLMYDAPWGGSEVLWAQTAALALAEGHEVFVATYAWPELAAPLQALAAAGASFYYRPRYKHTLQHRAGSLLRRLVNAGQLPEVVALRRFAPDAVIVSQGGWNDLLFHQQLADCLRKIPFLLICHNYHDPVRQDERQRARMIDLYDQAREVLMISDQQLRVLRRQLATPLANARVVQNPLNLPKVYPVPYPSLTIGAVAQLAVIGSLDVDRKGHDVLLEVLAAPEWQARAWYLHVYGLGPDQAYLERLIAFYALQTRVTLHGHITDRNSMWTNTHMVIVPSRIESGPMVVQEALLCGRPVVAADVGLVRNWVREGQTGFIADTSSTVALGKALNRAWVRQAEWEAIGQKAADEAVAHLITDPVGDFWRRIQALC